MKSVMVGYKQSDEARDALMFARELARAEHAELHVAGAFPDGPLPFAGDSYEEMCDQHFEKLFAEVEQELDGMEFVPHKMALDSPPKGLQKLAEEIEPEAIVVGSTHRGKVGRVLPGSVGERLLHGAPCPVVVAPRGYAGRAREGIRTIGVGYDGSDEAKLALASARGWAERLGASVRLIAVVPRFETPRIPAGHDIPYERAIEEDLNASLGEAESELGDLASELVVAHGDPAETLAEQSGDLDLLAVGSRGYGPVRRVLLGDVSSGVMRSAACPVLVTPRTGAAYSESPAAKAVATVI